MIEIIARGPVKRRTDQRISKTDGHDDIYGRVSVVETVSVEIDLEFLRGYVNLEGYAPSHYATRGSPLGSIGAYLPEDTEPIPDEWDVQIVGEWFDWVQQAHRYTSERPGESIVSCLEKFKNWDETNSRQIEEAFEKLSGVQLADKSGLNGREWDSLREELNELENVQIPESYSD